MKGFVFELGDEDHHNLCLNEEETIEKCLIRHGIGADFASLVFSSADGKEKEKVREYFTMLRKLFSPCFIEKSELEFSIISGVGETLLRKHFEEFKRLSDNLTAERFYSYLDEHLEKIKKALDTSSGVYIYYNYQLFSFIDFIRYLNWHEKQFDEYKRLYKSAKYKPLTFTLQQVFIYYN